MRDKWIYDLFNPSIIYNWESSSFLSEGDKILEEGKTIEIKTAPASSLNFDDIAPQDEDSEPD